MSHYLHEYRHCGSNYHSVIHPYSSSQLGPRSIINCSYRYMYGACYLTDSLFSRTNLAMPRLQQTMDVVGELLVNVQAKCSCIVV